jgi:hypothetical protein
MEGAMDVPKVPSDKLIAVSAVVSRGHFHVKARTIGWPRGESSATHVMRAAIDAARLTPQRLFPFANPKTLHLGKRRQRPSHEAKESSDRGGPSSPEAHHWIFSNVRTAPIDDEQQEAGRHSGLCAAGQEAVPIRSLDLPLGVGEPICPSVAALHDERPLNSPCAAIDTPQDRVWQELCLPAADAGPEKGRGDSDQFREFQTGASQGPCLLLHPGDVLSPTD